MKKQDNYYKLKADVEQVIKEYQNDPELGEQLRRLKVGVEEGQAFLVFDGDVGTKYRIAVPYLNKIYIVGWFQLSSDGSLYFGVRDENTDKRKAGTVKSEGGMITIDVNEKNLPPLITDSKAKDRFSFHGSGEIHDLEVGHTTYRPSIRESTEQSELFWVVFKEISKFDECQQLRKNDISIMTVIQEKHALALHAWISPSDKVQLHGINDGNNNFFIIINFHEIDTVGDLSLQLVFSPLPDPEAPERTIVVWPTIGIKRFENGGENDGFDFVQEMGSVDK